MWKTRAEALRSDRTAIFWNSEQFQRYCRRRTRKAEPGSIRIATIDRDDDDG